jgi:hypothetical protein
VAGRSAALCLLLVLTPSLTGGQSLGDAAKKERERREKMRQAGGVAAPTVDADSLAANRGSLANDTSRPASTVAETPRPATIPPAAGAGGTETYWRSRAAAARRRVDEAQRRVDAFDRVIRFGQSGEYDANGRRVIYSQQQLKQMADEAGEELAAARAAFERLEEDGRRAGALPGWLR